jgi:hypothetical protein
MSDKDDDTPVISLAAKREDKHRNFAEERSECIKELLELGLSKEEAAAAAAEFLLCDWLACRAGLILHDFDHDAEAFIKLIEIMRRGIDERLVGD